MLNDIAGRFSRAFAVEDVLNIALQEISQLASVSDVSIHLSVPEATSE
jgi:hypothetical protein